MSFRPPMTTPPRTANFPSSVAREYAAPAPAPEVASTPAPTLRVMRLQKPELHVSTTASSSVMAVPSTLRSDGTLLHETNSPSILQTALCLPDSLTVYVGETFTAYLGVLNTASQQQPIRRLTVVAQLQTPSQRYPLPSRLETPQDVVACDAIVARTMDEAGPHILRVEVSYLQAADGNRTSFRKFYRFQVRAPLLIHDATVIRTSDTSCLISVHIENPVAAAGVENEKSDAAAMILSSVVFEASDGLVATLLKSDSNDPTTRDDAATPTAVQLYDQATALRPGGRVAVLFQLHATAAESLLRGLAAGDVLGRVAVTWAKAMGERGTLYSSPVFCPRHFHAVYDPAAAKELPHCHVYRSGRAVDMAAASAAAVHSDAFTITVEPIDPPARMPLHVPVTVQLLVVNHTSEALTGLQLQFPLTSSLDLVVQGPSCRNVGPVAAHGGSRVTSVTFLALRAGLFRVPGGTVVDVASGRAAPQPPLWTALVTE